MIELWLAGVLSAKNPIIAPSIYLIQGPSFKSAYFAYGVQDEDQLGNDRIYVRLRSLLHRYADSHQGLIENGWLKLGLLKRLS